MFSTTDATRRVSTLAAHFRSGSEPSIVTQPTSSMSSVFSNVPEVQFALIVWLCLQGTLVIEPCPWAAVWKPQSIGTSS